MVKRMEFGAWYCYLALMCVLANKISKLAFGQEKQLSSLEGRAFESSKNIECNPDGILEGSFVASISL